MSTKRTTRLKPLVKGPNGRNLCRWCGTECAAARRTFCGPECVHQYLIRSQPGYARHCVEERDNGVCCECGEQCGSPADRRRRLIRLASKASSAGDHDIAKLLRENAQAMQWNNIKNEGVFVRAKDSSYFKGPKWDCDHIIPVVEGGGECGLENLRTLCRPCHKRVTAELARRRALSRKPRV